MTFAVMENGRKVLTMDEYIERTEELILAVNAGARAIENTKRYHGASYCFNVFSANHKEIPYLKAAEVLRGFEEIPAVDVAPVRHGRWELTVHSFYRDTFDESCELCVYIVANCSECSGNHPNSYQVFSKTLYAPDDADDDFRFDQKAEEEKALLEFRNKKYEFAHYCPNCGAKMDLED